MKEIFLFNSMLTPKIITVVYWVLLFFTLVSGLGMMFTSQYGGVTLGNFLMGLGVIIGGAIGARIWCELLIVLFKINDNIKTLASK
ncbi:DUF4282 domain-containing protein [Thiohalophilus sp.]|uniref:DUF4282 domain-containing protein n=1 Tax=Thiohalophilus sp. TaxID=3028392 RepID=UPI0039766135